MEQQQKSSSRRKKKSSDLIIRDCDSDSSDVFVPTAKKKLRSSRSRTVSSSSDEVIETKLRLNLSESSSSDGEHETNVTHSAPSTALSDHSLEDDISSVGDKGISEMSHEYYDFSNIITTQQLIQKHQVLKQKSDEGATLDKRKVSPRIRLSVSKKKPDKKRVQRESSDCNSNKDEALNVLELLAIGENESIGELTHVAKESELRKGDNESNKGCVVKIQVPNLSIVTKKSKCIDPLRSSLNAFRKTEQKLMHQVHLLCLIAHGNYLNTVINDALTQSTTLSLIPSDKFYPPKQATLEYLEKLVSWFSKKISLVKDSIPPDKELEDLLTHQLQDLKAYSVKYLVMMFVCTCRVLGLKCRLILSLQPVPMKPAPLKLSSDSKSNTKNSDSEVSTDEDLAEVPDCNTAQLNPKRGTSSDKTLEHNSKTRSKVKNSQSPGSKRAKSNAKKANAPSASKISKHNIKKDRKVLSPDIDNPSDSPRKKKQGVDVWCEVFLESEEKWISVDVFNRKVHCVDEIYAQCTHPVIYVLGWNNDLTIKDLTRRYAPQWMTTTRKLRIDESWWDESLFPWKPKQTAREKEEDYELDKLLEDKPLPATVAEYRSHPLYVLQRHLLKFEAVYPPDAPPIGFVKGEPVYSRLCVHQLHSKETWMREARTIRLNEKPYKIVKARPKIDKLTGQKISGLPLEIFGKWQTEDYIPPIATDGKVPRNEYGNVEMYKPCMIPGGTVHLEVPGLMRVARKLNIDCAPAVVGWEYSGCGSHPIFNGFIVCEEYKDIILDQWNKDIDENAKKDQKKVEQRVLGNWKKLIRGLIIRERLDKRYNFGPICKEDRGKKGNKIKRKK